jgi:hypothetical protein
MLICQHLSVLVKYRFTVGGVEFGLDWQKNFKTNVEKSFSLF